MHNKGDSVHQEKPYYLKAQTLEGERGIGNAHTLYNYGKPAFNPR